MIIQRLIRGMEPKDLLYVRYYGEVAVSNDSIVLNQNAGISTDTYFNSLSIGKWFTYCNMRDLKLVLEFCGNIKVQIVYAYRKAGEMIAEILLSQEVIAKEKTQWEYVFLEKSEGVVYYRIDALKDNTVLYNVYYDCIPVVEKNVTIALNICTFKREKYLMMNIEVLKQTFLKKEDSVLYQCQQLKMYLWQRVT